MSPCPDSHYRALDRRAFLSRSAAGLAAGALLQLPGPAQAVPRATATGFLVLDNCDPDFRGKEAYEDNLSCYSADGKLIFRASGLNNAEETGCPHKIAVDARRHRIWVSENVGHRLLQFDQGGKELLAIPDIQANSLALDPATGNVWVIRSTGTIYGSSLEVYGPDGQQLAAHPWKGFDIAYDGKSKAFWLAGQELVKTTLEGEAVVQKHIADWCSSSVGVNQKTGDVWVTTREYRAPHGRNELLGFDNDGKEVHTIALGAQMPFRLAVDSKDGSVWVAALRGPVLRYSAKGDLESEFKVRSLALDVEAGTGNVWVATEEEVLKLNRKGETLVKAKHKSKTSQAWVASF